MTDVINLGEEKRIRESYESCDASAWTPRDVIVDLLRDIDTGKVAPTSLIVTWIEQGEEEDTVRSGNYRVSARNVYESTFMISRLAFEHDRGLSDGG